MSLCMTVNKVKQIFFVSIGPFVPKFVEFDTKNVMLDMVLLYAKYHALNLCQWGNFVTKSDSDKKILTRFRTI